VPVDIDGGEPGLIPEGSFDGAESVVGRLEGVVEGA
jgi:hypothetical protein